MTDLRYPVGEFQAAEQSRPTDRKAWIKIIADFPDQMAAAVAGLSEDQLNWVYRPGGWNIRQVVHHCADSHMNAYVRFKLALTEDNPTIVPYDEAAWATLADTPAVPVQASIDILRGLHARWVSLLEQMSETDYQRTFFHPEHQLSFTLLLGLDNYQWHCRHHLGHIAQAKAHRGQFSV